MTGPNSHYAIWEINKGFTDSWLGLKYQFLHGKWPLAFEVNTRFPDLYNEPSEIYTRFHYQYIKNQTVVIGDSSYKVNDTIVEPGSEWRGLLKRDFAGIIHFGHSFFQNGALYMQGFAGYNIRQGAFSDQIRAGINGGYNWRVSDKINIIPGLSFDYVGGIGNGEQPDFTDRFYSAYKNYNFNNSEHLRGYFNVDFLINNRFDAKVGVGEWLWGKGEVKYTEAFVQLSHLIGKNCN
jgi:hypothetical protein